MASCWRSKLWRAEDVTRPTGMLKMKMEAIRLATISRQRFSCLTRLVCGLYGFAKWLMFYLSSPQWVDVVVDVVPPCLLSPSFLFSVYVARKTIGQVSRAAQRGG